MIREHSADNKIAWWKDQTPKGCRKLAKNAKKKTLRDHRRLGTRIRGTFES